MPRTGFAAATTTLVAAVWINGCFAQTPLPTADFFRQPQVQEVTLSPSGRYLAIESLRDVGTVQLSVVDLDHPEDTRIVSGWGDVDVQRAQWANDDRLVFAAVDLHVNLDDWRTRSQGWFSVKRDGTRMVRDVLGINPVALGRLADGSPNVVVVRSNGERTDPLYSLWRVDTRSGHDVNLSKDGPARQIEWLFDESGTLQAVMAQQKDRKGLYRREADRWVCVLDQPIFDVGTIDLYEFHHGRAYVLAGVGPASHRALFEYDLSNAKLADKPVVTLEGYDFRGRLVFDDDAKTLIGIEHLTDDWSTTWLDPGMKSLQKRVDELLPGLTNNIKCSNHCTTVRRVVVLSYSDRTPAVYSVYDRETQTLRTMMASRPWISPDRMGQRRVVRFAARDGLPIPVTLTYPPDAHSGDAPRPAVVLIHDGPWQRGATWGWSSSAQFLASRGYVVLEPEYRGSSGFGERHLQAGFKQWGLAMQDDIADAAKWAADGKLIDPQRVCVAGQGYGGYAVLMGLIRNPDQFRCGISWNAPTDIDAMYAFDWSDTGEIFKTYGMPRLVADRSADAAQIAATSPLRLAGKINRPLLLAYGVKDRHIPIEHGIRLRDALKANDAKVEWVEYRTEGHDWFLLQTKINFWTRVEKFLAAQLLADSPGTR